MPHNVSDRKIPAWSHTLALAVRSRRKAFHLTQQQLADTAGCSKLTICQLESGKPTARLEIVIRVLSTLGLELKLQEGDAGIADRS
jgi:HTH-type transcriptional regulator / antitoxin HipB